MKIRVKVIPNSKHFKVISDGDGLKMWLTSPAIEGRANEELRLRLRKILHVAKSCIEVVAGHTQKSKVVDILGVSTEDMKKLLG